jgi:hypothetical protein
MINRHMRIRIAMVFLALFLNGLTPVFSQEDCAVNLQRAQTDFDRGRVELVAGSIVPCLNSGGFTREDELTAYKLLIQALLLDEKAVMADEMMLDFLKKNPEYVPTAADYTGFVYLMSKYQVKPVFMVSAKAGLNYTFLSGKSERSLSSLDPDISYASEPLNIHAGAEVLLPMTLRLRLAAGLFYSSSSFRYTENMMNFGTVYYRESQTRVEIPVSAIYDFARVGNISLSARLGFGYQINLNTDSKSSFTPSDINNGFNRTGENLSRSVSRINSELFIHGGLGGAVKIPRGYITGELKANLGTRNQTIRSNPANLEYFYFYSDDDFRINMVSITIGYIHIFYRPLKIQIL